MAISGFGDLSSYRFVDVKVGIQNLAASRYYMGKLVETQGWHLRGGAFVTKYAASLGRNLLFFRRQKLALVERIRALCKHWGEDCARGGAKICVV